MAEHYGTAIIPARVRKPKDKPTADGTVNNVSIWITAALRNEQFFSLAELNAAIKKKLEQFKTNTFQKKECSRRSLFLGKKCHYWHRCLLLTLNCVTGNQPCCHFESKRMGGVKLLGWPKV